MAVRVGGEAVEPEREALAAAFPDATPRLVVFLHGLMETEFSWRLRRAASTYGARLRRDLGCTPVYVRYNTGRHISENGRSLAELLEELVADVAGRGRARSRSSGTRWAGSWRAAPATRRRSDGDGVGRAACATSSRSARRTWARRWRRASTAPAPALHALPETRPFGDFLRRRSAGIRDLRQGSLVDEDWRDRDPDALRADGLRGGAAARRAPRTASSPRRSRATPRHPLGRLVGDMLVLEPSASGRSRTRRLGFATRTACTLGGAHHLALLNHPAVYERLREWLSVSPEPEVPALPAPAPG